MERRCPDSKTLKVKLDSQVRQNSGARWSSRSVATGERLKETKVL